MIAYWCGFNGFSQISTENSSSVASSQFKLVPLNDIKDIDFAWPCAVVLSVRDVYISGFCGNHSTFFKKLTKPNPELEFLKVGCNETYALITSEDGECWQYFYNTDKWKKLSKFIAVEEDSDVSSSKRLEFLHSNVESHVPYQSGNDRKKIIKICCGEIVNIALDSCGQAYSIPSPISMPGIKILQVACGFEHCLLLDEFGRLYSSGSGMRGQLGCEILETVDSPQEVEALSGLHVIRIGAGGWHSAAVTSSGVLYTWGWNNSGQLGFPTVKSSESTSDYGQGETQNYDTKANTECTVQENENDCSNDHKNKKRKLTVFDESDELNNLSQYSENKMQDVKLSKMHKGREGASTEPKECVTVLAVPRPVDFPSWTDVNVVDVSCGNRHTVVLADDGTVWGCGWNAYGQLGISPDNLMSVESMIKLDISVDEKICGVHCGGWNTVIFCNK